jgi:hypothetical protein
MSRSLTCAVTFGRPMARTSHLPSSALVVISYLSSTWGRADQQTSHDSIESGAFCFARKSIKSRVRNEHSGKPRPSRCYGLAAPAAAASCFFAILW